MSHMKQASRGLSPRFGSAVLFNLYDCPIRPNYYFHLIDLTNCNLLNVVSKVPFYLWGYVSEENYVCFKEHTFWG